MVEIDGTIYSLLTPLWLSCTNMYHSLRSTAVIFSPAVIGWLHGQKLVTRMRSTRMIMRMVMTMTMIINCNQGTQVRLSNELELLSSSRESACRCYGMGPHGIPTKFNTHLLTGVTDNGCLLKSRVAPLVIQS